jgi:hypothetical protein
MVRSLIGGLEMRGLELMGRKSAFIFAAVSALAISHAAFADITGFGDGSNYTLNGYHINGDSTVADPATISEGALIISDLTPGQARSAFFNTKQSDLSFIASFIFQDLNTDLSPIGAPDGFAFILQNQGLTAVGGQASGLGVNNPDGPASASAIVPSAGVEFFLRNGNGATTITNNGSGQFANGVSTAPVDLADGDPILITLAYDGLNFQLTEVMTDLTTNDTYTLNRSFDIQDIIGPTVFVGFTGATGGAYANQTISNFSFVSAVPEPASLGLLLIGAPLLAARRRRA